jgi:3-dehydroquinate synthase
VRLPDGPGYDIVVGPGVSGEVSSWLLALETTPRVAVLTDQEVHRLHGHALRSSLDGAGLDASFIVIPPGEPSKSLGVFEWVVTQLASKRFDRRAVLVNFGGGVVCDLGGFVAAAYMRGVRYVNVATSLMAQVDAAIGGKVAVNTSFSKNFIGSFHNPGLVVNDTDFLTTLGDGDFRSGIAEAIKVAIIADPGYFSFLEENAARIKAREGEVLVEMIASAGRIKIALLEPDPYERELRRSLNFGHTIGHPVETSMAYRGLRHGEAVAVGMMVASVIARRRGIVTENDFDRIIRVLAAYDLHGLIDEHFDVDAALDRIGMVELIRARNLHFVLPTGIGSVVITEDVTSEELREGFSRLHEFAPRDREACS